MIKICPVDNTEAQFREIYMAVKIGEGWLTTNNSEKSVQLLTLLDSKINDLSQVIKNDKDSSSLVEWCIRVLILKFNILQKFSFMMNINDVSFRILKVYLENHSLSNTEMETFILTSYNTALFLYQTKNLQNSNIILEFDWFLMSHGYVRNLSNNIKSKILRLFGNVLLDLKDDSNINQALIIIREANKIDQSLPALYLEIKIILAVNTLDLEAVCTAIINLTNHSQCTWDYISNSLSLLLQNIEKHQISPEWKDTIKKCLRDIDLQYLPIHDYKLKLLLLKVEFMIFFNDLEVLNQILDDEISNYDKSNPETLSVLEQTGNYVFNKGFTFSGNNDISSALSYFLLSKKVFDISNNVQWRTVNLRNICRCYINLGDFEQATVFVDELLICDGGSVRNGLMKIEILCNLGNKDAVENAIITTTKLIESQSKDQYESYIITLMQIIFKFGKCISTLLTNITRFLSTIISEKVLFDVISMVLQFQLNSLADISNENMDLQTIINDTIAFLDQVIHNVTIYVNEVEALLKLTELIVALSVQSRKFPSQSLVLIQYNFKIFQNVSLTNNDVMVLFMKTSYIQSLLQKNLVDENIPCDINSIENCLAYANTTRKLLTDNYQLLSASGLLDAYLKCGYIEIQCMVSLVNDNIIDKNRINLVIEELFSQNIQKRNLIDPRWYMNFTESVVYVLSSQKLFYYTECKLLLTICLEVAIDIADSELISRYKCLIFDCVMELGNVPEMINIATELCANSNNDTVRYIGSRIWNRGISLFRQEKYDDAKSLSLKGSEILNCGVISNDFIANIKEFEKILSEKLNSN